MKTQLEIIADVDHRRNLRKYKVIGVLSKASLLAKLAGIYSHPDFQPDMDVLWDFSCANFSVADIDDIEEVATFVESNWSGGSYVKVAFVAPDVLGSLIAETYANLLAGKPEGNIKIFPDEESALRWLA